RFTEVDADADLDAHLAPGVPKSQRAFDRATRTLESGQRAIASMVRDATTEQTHVFSQDAVVTIQESPPRGISQLGGTFGRVDDVGKEQRHDDSLRFAAAPNAGHEFLEMIKDQFGRFPEWQGIGAREFHESCASNVLSDVSRLQHRNPSVVATYHHEGRGLNTGQDWPSVHL